MEFTTKGGAKVKLEIASLDKAFKLKALVEKALLKQGIKITELLNKEEISGEELFNMAMAVDSDPDVFDACFECMDKSIYNDIAIKKSVFEDETARADLYEVLFYCLKVNVYPFFRTLLSSLKTPRDSKKGEESLTSI